MLFVETRLLAKGSHFYFGLVFSVENQKYACVKLFVENAQNEATFFVAAAYSIYAPSAHRLTIRQRVLTRYYLPSLSRILREPRLP